MCAADRFVRSRLAACSRETPQLQIQEPIGSGDCGNHRRTERRVRCNRGAALVATAACRDRFDDYTGSDHRIDIILMLASKSVATGMGYYFPIIESAGRLSALTQWLLEGVSISALTLIFRFAPNLRERKLEANLPGAILTLVCWLLTSATLRII